MESIDPALNMASLPPRENTEQSPSTQDDDANKAYSTHSIHPESAFKVAALADTHEKIRRASRLTPERSAPAEPPISLQDSSNLNDPVTPSFQHNVYVGPLVTWPEKDQSHDSRYDFVNTVPRSFRLLM